MMDLSGAVLAHASRGVRLQLLLRAALIVFLLLTIILLPPTQGVAAFYGIVVAYAVGALLFARWAWRGDATVVEWGWLGLLADLVVLATLTLVAGVDAQNSWTSDVLGIGFFLCRCWPPRSCGRGSARRWSCRPSPSNLIACLFTQAANVEPSESIVLRTFMLASVGAACVGLSRIQRSRVSAIGGLLQDRGGCSTTSCAWRSGSDGTCPSGCTTGRCSTCWRPASTWRTCPPAPPAAVDRVDQALAESTRMLRSTVSELHPAVRSTPAWPGRLVTSPRR